MHAEVEEEEALHRGEGRGGYRPPEGAPMHKAKGKEKTKLTQKESLK
jgi:hypothetical protein